jgi:Chalcone-flavanone isomerase.
MKKIMLVVALMVLAMPAMALTVEGKNYQPTITVADKTLNLVGAGLRKKWLFSVYTMGVYSESGSCDTKALINDEEVKYMRIDMVRSVSAQKMAETLGEAFKAHMPKDASAELKKQQQDLMSYFKDECKEGTNIEFSYVPGVGTTFKQNSKELGETFIGKDFQVVLWDIYLGDKTCCSGLKEDILKSCKKK